MFLLLESTLNKTGTKINNMDQFQGQHCWSGQRVIETNIWLKPTDKIK